MSEYIDRKAVLDELDEDIEEFVECDYALKTAKKYIKKIPPADVRPVVHGRWISDGNGFHWVYVCSVCGWKDGYPFNERHNFCPNCGADLRGGDAE